jgi:hypothetical protein
MINNKFMLKKIIILLLLFLFPLSSFAIFRDVWTTYFFQNKDTKEIKKMINARDEYDGFFSYSISDYVNWKNFNDNIFKNWNLIEVRYCNRGNCVFQNKWKFTLIELYSSISKKENLDDSNIMSWSNLKTDNLKTFKKEDLDNSELFNIYYKYIFLEYYPEFFKYLILNLIVFYPVWYFLFKKNPIKKRKILKMLFISLIFYILSDILLYSLWWWYSQAKFELFWEQIYSMGIWNIKLVAFWFWIYLIFKDINQYFRQKKK